MHFSTGNHVATVGLKSSADFFFFCGDARERFLQSFMIPLHSSFLGCAPLHKRQFDPLFDVLRTSNCAKQFTEKWNECNDFSSCHFTNI